MADPIPYLSFFSGVAGLDLALRIAFPSVRSVGYCEREFAACKVLASRMEEGSIDIAPIFTDVRTFPSELYRGRVAGIVAGFPCPDYSVAGKRAGIVGKHGQLWDYLATAIRDVGPDWLLLENVTGILVAHGADDGTILPAGLWFVLGDLASLGFDAEWCSLRASDVGASHGRNRWFCLAYRKGGRLGILRESSGGYGLTDGSNKELGYSAMHGERVAPGRSGGCVADTDTADTNQSETERIRRATAEPFGERPSVENPRCGKQPKCCNSEQVRDRGNSPTGSADSASGPNGDVADSGDGFISQPRRGSEGRNGAGSGGAILRERVGTWQCEDHGPYDAFEFRGDTRYLRADGEWMLMPGQCPECGSSGDYLTYDPAHGGASVKDFYGDRKRGALGNPDLTRLEGRDERGQPGTDERAIGQAGDTELADAAEFRRRGLPAVTGSTPNSTEAQRTQESTQYDGQSSGGSTEELADDNGRGFGIRPDEAESESTGWRGTRESESGRSLPLFAPGPGATELWQRILRDFPYLAPAISAEETERLLHSVADEFSASLACSRTDGLRACGNAVVPLQAAAAIRILAKRAGIAL